MRFEKAQQCNQNRRIRGPVAKPNWGQAAQLKEPLRSPFVGKGRSQRN